MENLTSEELLKELDKYYDIQDDINEKIKVLESYIFYRFRKIGRTNRGKKT